MTDGLTMPFCKGCGHAHVLRKLDEALTSLGISPSDVCLVTDIGCIGLADSLFGKVHTVHTTHGRSTAFATGIALADSIMGESKLKPIVLIGDGGAMIGLLHLVHAAQLNVDVTVLLCNNFLFGMTGGQHSAFSPVDFISQTTPDGNMIPPIDMCRVISGSRAGFVARKLATDKDLSATIADAISAPGFSLVEIVELCTEHATSRNELKGNSLAQIAEHNGYSFGKLTNGDFRDPYGKLYKIKHFSSYKGAEKNNSLSVSCKSALKSKVSMIIAGSAGERVQSSARKLCEGAVMSGLFCTQKNDNPVTQGSGFSLSEVIISPEEIHYTGVDFPTVVILVSQDGVREMQSKNIFSILSSETLLLADETLVLPVTSATVVRHPFRKISGPHLAAQHAIKMYLERTQIFPLQAYVGRCTV